MYLDDHIFPRLGSFQLLFIFYKIYLFYFWLLSLYFCAWAFSSCGKWGLLSSCDAWASHCDGPSCCEAWALGVRASVVVAHGLSCSMVCGIFPDQGLNLCPLHWQADSQPLDHQRSPPLYSSLVFWQEGMWDLNSLTRETDSPFISPKAVMVFF